MTSRLIADALCELRSLVAYSDQTGQSVRSMIVLPPRLREALEAFCTEYPSDAAEIREGLDLRDLMLDYVDRHTRAELRARFAEEPDVIHET